MRISDITLLAVSSVAAGTDLCDGKIYQKWLGGGLCAALIDLLWQGALSELPDHLFGMVIPLGLLFLFFSIGALGGGDVKLFAVIGFFLGVRGSLYCMLAAFLIGVVFGLGRMLLRGALKECLRRLLTYGKQIFLTRHIQSYEWEPGGRNLLHMSVPAMLSVWLYLEGVV